MSMATTRIETADVEALEHRVREIGHGLITFDGCMLAGKTELMREIERRLKVQGLDLDDFVERQQGVFFDAIRFNELTAAIEQARLKSSIVLLSGICMLEVLERTGYASDLAVYVQANIEDGTPDDIDLIGAETGRHPELIEFFGELENECFSYHARYRPRSSADVLFVRTLEPQKPGSITEWSAGHPLPAGATDTHLLEDADALTSTNWDIAVENPPHEGYDGFLPHPDLNKPT